MKFFFIFAGTCVFALREPAKDMHSAALAAIANPDEMLTVVDCDGKEYQMPLAGTDAWTAERLVEAPIEMTDRNGLGDMILKMADAKRIRLQSLSKEAPKAASAVDKFLASLSPSANTACVADIDSVHSDSVSERYGENTPLFIAQDNGRPMLEDEPKSFVGRAITRLLRQERYKRKPLGRMFHSDQINVKVEDILPEHKDRLHLYQGDMVYHKESFLNAEAVAGTTVQDSVVWSPWRTWTGAKVNWYVDPAAPVDDCATATFRTAASMIEKYTCVRFKEGVTPRDGVSSVKLTSNGKSCWAYVGMSEVSQVNLGGEGCQIPGIALHELGHALGLIHQQSRTNRNQYVTIDWDNIKNAAVDNFKKISSPASSYEKVVASKAYDYSSIMHYSTCEFSVDRHGSPCAETITPAYKTVADHMGQREYLSEIDMQTINQMYGCTATCGDGFMNQGETGIDCGGPCARKCNDTTSDGILDVPDRCKADTGRSLTPMEWYLIFGIAGGFALLVFFTIYQYAKSRQARKDNAKQKLLANSRMSAVQLQNALKQRSGMAPIARPSAPPVGLYPQA